MLILASVPQLEQTLRHERSRCKGGKREAQGRTRNSKVKNQATLTFQHVAGMLHTPAYWYPARQPVLYPLLVGACAASGAVNEYKCVEAGMGRLSRASFPLSLLANEN